MVWLNPSQFPCTSSSGFNRELGISDKFFSLGDSVILTVLGQLAFMPILVLAARICPPGVEATLFAGLMSIFNAGGVCLRTQPLYTVVHEMGSSRMAVKAVTGGWKSGWEAFRGGYKAVGGPLGADRGGWQG